MLVTANKLAAKRYPSNIIKLSIIVWIVVCVCVCVCVFTCVHVGWLVCVDYRQVRNEFPPSTMNSEDWIQAIKPA